MILPRDIPHGRKVPPEVIRYHVMVAMQQARRSPEMTVEVHVKGWGHPARVIAPMFDYCPNNVRLPYEFQY